MWVMIIVVIWTNPSVATAIFDSKEACERAGIDIQVKWGKYGPSAGMYLCEPQGYNQ